MKVISFIGAGSYQVSRYRYGDGEVETHLFPHAVSTFFKPDTLLVLLTPKAQAAKPPFTPETQSECEQYLDRLVKLHGLECLRDRNKTYFQHLCEIHAACGLVTPRTVTIPNGSSEAELWQIFRAMADNLTNSEEVVFDITHAFRSLPLLAFIAAVYLRKIKEINLKAIVYGAFEAAQTTPDGTRLVPVFDLTPFVELLDWTTATHQFIKTGDAEDLAEMIQRHGSQAEPLANNLRSIAQGLSVLRPLDVLRAAAQLPREIERAKPHIESEMPPFAPLLERVKRDYGRFGFARPHAPKNRDEGRRCLSQQLKMIDWYERKEQVMHALSLAREWIVSLVCFELRIDPLDYKNRDKVERLLNGGYRNPNSSLLSKWEEIDLAKRERLLRLWGGAANKPLKTQMSPELTSLRNDVLHAGLDHRAKRTEKVVTKTRAIVEELKEIGFTWLYGKEKPDNGA